jgi:periplasmic protein TonB
MSNYFIDKFEFDDLVFEHRNKEYGAYPIRKKYNSTIIISILVASFIVCALVIFPYLQINGTKNDLGRQIRLRYVEMKLDKLEPPKEDIYVPPVPKPPPPNTIANIAYIAPVIVDTLLPAEKQLPTVAEVESSNPETNKNAISGTGNGDDLLTGQDGEKSDEPFIYVEVNPTFKGGGIEKFRDWVQKRTIYPQIAQDNGIQGKVILTFIVERDGSVSNVRVIKSVDKLLDDEAVKAIESSPKWSPGLQRGRPVRVRFNIPLVFAFGR